MQSIRNTLLSSYINKGNVILLLLLCLSFTLVTHAKNKAGLGQYIGAVDFSDVDNCDKNDHLDDNDGFVEHDCCQCKQFTPFHLFQNKAGFYLADAFIRPLTRAPPQVTI